MELEVLKLAFLLSVFILIGFGYSLFIGDFGDPRMTDQDKYTVFLRKHWIWILPLVSFGIGLLGALTITGTI